MILVTTAGISLILLHFVCIMTVNVYKFVNIYEFLHMKILMYTNVFNILLFELFSLLYYPEHTSILYVSIQPYTWPTAYSDTYIYFEDSRNKEISSIDL